jgi:hypothetical protein
MHFSSCAGSQASSENRKPLKQIFKWTQPLYLLGPQRTAFARRLPPCLTVAALLFLIPRSLVTLSPFCPISWPCLAKTDV